MIEKPPVNTVLRNTSSSQQSQHVLHRLSLWGNTMDLGQSMLPFQVLLDAINIYIKYCSSYASHCCVKRPDKSKWGKVGTIWVYSLSMQWQECKAACCWSCCICQQSERRAVNVVPLAFPFNSGCMPAHGMESYSLRLGLPSSGKSLWKCLHTHNSRFVTLVILKPN